MRALWFVPVLAVVLASAGCGSDDAPSSTTEARSTTAETRSFAPAAPTAASLRVADQEAKSAARNVVVLVESCFTSTETYTDCTTGDALGGAEFEIVTGRPEAGEVAVTKATDSTYRVLAPSASGNRFAATRRGGQIIRSCSTKAETGGCRNGSW